MGLPRVVFYRPVAACATVPGARVWGQAAGLLVLFAAVALPVGLGSGFLEIDVVSAWRVWVRVTLVSLLFPAVAEEMLFRVLLLPHPSERASAGARWSWGTLGLVLFVASHPLKAASASPARQAVFVDPAFLLLAALLGLVCTVAYLRTGSLWPPVLIHWAAAIGWLLVLGGYGRLGGGW